MGSQSLELSRSTISNNAENLKAQRIIKLEKDIPQAEYDKNLLTTKGKLSLILADDDLLQKLSDRFIDAEVAKRLDYPIFMAIADDIGYDATGRPTKTNELEPIAAELARFISAVEGGKQ